MSVRNSGQRETPTDFDLGLETDVGAAPPGEVLDVNDVPRRLDGVRLVAAVSGKQVRVLGAAVANLDALRPTPGRAASNANVRKTSKKSKASHVM